MQSTKIKCVWRIMAFDNLSNTIFC